MDKALPSRAQIVIIGGGMWNRERRSVSLRCLTRGRAVPAPR